MPKRPPKVTSPLAGRKPARRTANQRGYTYQWQRTSQAYLDQHPLCVTCERFGRITEATEVDHVIPHRGDQTLFWNSKNWQPLCKPCHSKKTNEGQ